MNCSKPSDSVKVQYTLDKKAFIFLLAFLIWQFMSNCLLVSIFIDTINITIQGHYGLGQKKMAENWPIKSMHIIIAKTVNTFGYAHWGSSD